MQEQAASIIEARDLVVGYGAETILDKVNVDIYRGEVFAILGGSGCGKTTLMKAMIGLLEPFSGSVRIDGQDLLATEGEARSKLLRKIGVMYQQGALFGSMSLLENVCVPLEEHTNLPTSARSSIARSKLSMVGLGGYEDYLPGSISGGMMKRAAIARAMALDPQILFLDEPSAGLDPITSAGLDKLIAKLSSILGITFVLVTHELPSILSVVDRCIMLEASAQGIVAAGDPKEMMSSSKNVYVRKFFDRRADETREIQGL